MKLEKILKPAYLLLVAFTIVLSLFVYYISNKALNLGSADLRNRVVGARYLKANYDVYFTHWLPGMDEKFADPFDNPNAPVNRVTVTPLVLTIQNFFLDKSRTSYVRKWVKLENATLPSTIEKSNQKNEKIVVSNEYTNQVRIWFILSWIVATIGIFLFVLVQSEIHKKAYTLLGLIGLLGGRGWLFHSILGQIYIFYMLLFAATLVLVKYKREYVASFIIGFLIVLRPIYAIIIPFLFVYKKRLAISSCVSSIVSLCFSIYWSGVNVWKTYFLSLPIHTKIDRLALRLYDHRYYPELVENVRFLDKYDSEKSPFMSNLIYFLKTFNINLPNSFYLAFAILILSLILIFAIRIKNKTFDTMLLLAFFAVTIFELTMPVPRFMYYDVQFMIMITIIIKHIVPSISGFVLALSTFMYSGFSIFITNDYFTYFLTYSMIIVLGLYTYKSLSIKSVKLTKQNGE